MRRPRSSPNPNADGSDDQKVGQPAPDEVRLIRSVLAIVSATAVVLWLGSQGINGSAGDGTVPDLLPLTAIPSFVALALAFRYPASVIADRLLHSQFLSVTWIFGFLGVLGAALSLPDPKGWLFAAAGLAAGATIWRLREGGIW